MASAWGKSFGAAWGNSWGLVTEEETSSSGMIRLWLVDYYTKEWAKKTEAEKVVAKELKKPKKSPHKRRKVRSAPVAPTAPVLDVERLVSHAEAAITRAARLQRDVVAADAFIARLQAYTVELPFMVVDFGPVLERYAQEDATLKRRRTEEDDLLLLSMVL